MTQDSAAFLRAIRGPVMLITVGVLFALDNFTPFSFGRTWPILLVVVGILSLGKRAAPVQGKAGYRAQWGPPRPPMPPQPPQPPPPPDPFATTGSNATAGPGSYRGSAYEGTPGSTPRSAESRENREKGAPQ